MATAVDAVFDTVELLEAILWHLPMEGLHTVMRVNKSWKKTVERSLILQQALFLVPITRRPSVESLYDMCRNAYHLSYPDDATGKNVATAAAMSLRYLWLCHIPFDPLKGPTSSQYSQSYLNRLVSQPPLTAMQFDLLLHLDGIDLTMRHLPLIINVAGLRLRDVLAKVKEVSSREQVHHIMLKGPLVSSEVDWPDHRHEQKPVHCKKAEFSHNGFCTWEKDPDLIKKAARQWSVANKYSPRVLDEDVVSLDFGPQGKRQSFMTTENGPVRLY